MKVNPLTGAGAELLDVDVTSMTDNEFDAVKKAYADYGLIFFRDQTLTEEQHIEFARRFGDINVNRFFTQNERYPEIAMVTKEADQEVNIGGGWHTDHSYDLEPAMGSILVARELPETGGDTWFLSMYSAFETLSDGLKETLKGLRAVHSARHVFGGESGYKDRTGNRIGNQDAADELPDPVHPVVISHPLSGKQALYVNAAFTRRFEGWTEEESAPLLNYLYQQTIEKSETCKFEWKPGSIAFWDNRATWHFAQNDYHGERREMHRITIEGCSLGAA